MPKPLSRFQIDKLLILVDVKLCELSTLHDDFVLHISRHDNVLTLDSTRTHYSFNVSNPVSMPMIEDK